MASGYQFLSTPVIQKSPEYLTRLESAVSTVMKTSYRYSINGVDELLIDRPVGGQSVIDYDDQEVVELVDATLESLACFEVGDIEQIWLRWVTDSRAYNSYLRTNRDNPDGNWHCDYEPRRVGGEVIFLPKTTGRLLISLFGRSIVGLQGPISMPGSMARYYKSPAVDRGSRLFDGAKRFRGVLYGEQGHFLRGAVDMRRMDGGVTPIQIDRETWAYWQSSFVHRPTEVEQAGRANVIVDLKPGIELHS